MPFAFRAALLITGLFVTGICGCGSGQKSADSAGTPAPVVPTTLEDRSLTTDEYIKLGLPAADRDWSAIDMGNACKVFAQLAEKNTAQLPRFQSPKSGEVFSRMISTKNYAFFRNKTLPLSSRLPVALDYMDSSSAIEKIYAGSFIKHEVRDTELIELMGSQLRFTVVILELLDEFLPSISKDDPKYAVRMQGLEQMKSGLTTVVTAMLQILTERNSYSREELIKLIGTLKETLPKLVPRTTAGSQKEVQITLEKYQTDPAFKDLQPGLSELQAVVKEALTATK